MRLVTPDEFTDVLAEARRVLLAAADEDWSKPAGTLEWSCWQTVDHTIDCVFSYALQVAARAQSGFLPFAELHANSDASNRELIEGLGAVGQIFADVVSSAPPDMVASDGVLSLDLGDWCARAAYEVGLHTHDVACGLGVEWQVPSGLCRAIVNSPSLWMFDSSSLTATSDPWIALLEGSGRR
jgi:hypothetical protein